MERNFPEILSALRKGRNISQRQAAADLGISQALLGRSAHPGDVSLRDTKLFLRELRDLLNRAESALQSAEGEET